MSNIEQLESRLTAAMDRIAAGVAGLSHADTSQTSDPGDMAALQAALDEEKTVNAQLQERLRKVTQQQESGASGQAEAAQKLEALDLELQRLRKATEALRQSNAALREANAAGVGDAHLINKSMMAELEALRAARAADVAEAETILGALDAVLNEEAANA